MDIGGASKTIFVLLVVVLYYRFRGHLLVSGMGVITGFTLTPANGSEREATWDVIGGIRGLLIGDNLNKLHTAYYYNHI